MAAALDTAPRHTAADILQQLDADEAQAVLDAIQSRAHVAPLLAHGDESAGGIMSPAMPALRPDQTADNVIDYLRTLGQTTDEPYYLYVIDDDG